MKLTKIRGISVGQTANAAKFHRAWPNDVREKRYNFNTVSTLAPRGIPWAKIHQSRHCCTARPELSVCQISSSSDTLSRRYLQPNIVDFVERVTNRQRDRQKPGLERVQACTR